jgi:hypothetical protein
MASLAAFFIAGGVAPAFVRIPSRTEWRARQESNL